MTNYILFTILTMFNTAYAKDAPQEFNQSINNTFVTYFNKYKHLEYYSGAELSIYLPNKSIQNYYIGQATHDENSKKISNNTLFQIDSITKSFTAAVNSQLKKEGQLTLNVPICVGLIRYFFQNI